MSTPTPVRADENVYRLRMLPKDFGVALVTLLALAIGWLLLAQTTGQMREFQAEGTPFRISYPAGWISAATLADATLAVEDPRAPSTFKTTLTVERRELDPQNPPTLQTLVDRRIVQRGGLTGYHLLSSEEATVDGARAMQMEYAYVVQPIDQPLRAALPVVVHAREYIVVTQNETYYLTLAAPEDAFERAGTQFDRMLATVQVQ